MESKPLLPKVESDVDDQPQQLLVINRGSLWRKSKCIIAYGVLLLTASVLLFSKPADAFGWPFWGEPTLEERASSILSNTPLIDGHNDLAILIRELYNNHIYDEKFQNLFSEGGMPAHVDLPRLKEGKVGGAFWSAFMPCPKNGSDFSNENYAQCKLSFFIFSLSFWLSGMPSQSTRIPIWIYFPLILNFMPHVLKRQSRGSCL